MNYLGEVKEFWIGWITLRAIMPQLKKKKKKKKNSLQIAFCYCAKMILTDKWW